MRPLFVFKSEKKTDEGHLKRMREGRGNNLYFLFGLKCLFFLIFLIFNKKTCYGYSSEMYLRDAYNENTNKTFHKESTHLSRMEFLIIINHNWTGPFPFQELLGCIVHCYQNSNRTYCKQTVETMIRRRI